MLARTKRPYKRHIPPDVPPRQEGEDQATQSVDKPQAPSQNGHHAINPNLRLPRKADGTIDYDAVDFGQRRSRNGREDEESKDLRADLVSQVAQLVAQTQQGNPALDKLDPEDVDGKIRMGRIRRGSEMAVLFLRMVMATVNPRERGRIIPLTLETMLNLTVGSGGLGREDAHRILAAQIRAQSADMGGQP